MAEALELEKVVRLPYFCHSVIDDLPMSLEAFRMYAHLARKWGNGKFGALGSYVDMGEHKRTGSTPHPLNADKDQLELLGKEDKPTVLPPKPPAFISNQLEVIGFQPADLGQDKCSAADVVPEKICSNSSDSQPPFPTPTYRDHPKERFSRTPVQQDWEISPGVPYPAFVKWREPHYTKQGGHWADAATANAKSEIRNNPQRAADLWSQFLEFSNTAADNALAHQAQGMTPTLPSCFGDSQLPTRGEVIGKQRALVGVAQVALPQGVATPSCTKTVSYMPDSPTRPDAAAISSSASAASEPTLGTEIPDTQTLAGGQVSGCAGESVQKDSLCEQFPPAHLQPGLPASADLEWDTQQQEQNMRRLAQMIQSIKSMPKPQPQQPEPTNHFQKMRTWLQCDEPALRNEAIAWLVAVQDVEPVFDEYGNPYDFQEIEF